MTEVTFKLKQAAPVEIELDIDALTFEDAMNLMKLQNANDEEGINALCGILSRVAGQDVRTLPIRYVQPMTAAVLKAIQGDGLETKN